MTSSEAEYPHSYSMATLVELYSCIVLPNERPVGAHTPSRRSVVVWTHAILQVASERRLAQNPIRQRTHRRKKSSGSGLHNNSLYAVTGPDGSILAPWEPDARILDQETVKISADLQEWLNDAREFALEERHRLVTLVQARWKGFLVRKALRPICDVWRQIRQALAHAMRAQFIQEYGDDDYIDNAHGMDELQAVNMIIKTLQLMRKKKTPALLHRVANRISRAALAQKANILAVVQSKHTLSQVIGRQVVGVGLGADDEFAVAAAAAVEPKETVVHEAIQLLELLTFSLKEARRLDKHVLQHIYRTGMYAFDPMYDVASETRLGMQATEEFKTAASAHRALRVVTETLSSKMRRIYQSPGVAESVRTIVHKIDDVEMGVEVAEVNNARSQLHKIDVTCRRLEDAVRRNDKKSVDELLAKAMQVHLQRPIVERARVKSLELSVHERLASAMESRNIQLLAKTIQWSMDAILEEATRRKKRKQRKLRQKWIMKKKKGSMGADRDSSDVDADGADNNNNNTAPADIFGDEKDLQLDVDSQLQDAQDVLRQWMWEQRAASESGNTPAAAPSSGKSGGRVASSSSAPAASNSAAQNAWSTSSSRDQPKRHSAHSLRRMKQQEASILEQLAAREQQALNMALTEAASELTQMQQQNDSDFVEHGVLRSSGRVAGRGQGGRLDMHRTERRGEADHEKHGQEETPQRKEARKQVFRMLAKSGAVLNKLSAHQDERIQSRDLVSRPLVSSTAPMDTATLRSVVAEVERVLDKTAQCGMDLDLEHMEQMGADLERMDDLSAKYSSLDLHDAKHVTELRNSLLELRNSLTEREELTRKARQMVRQIAESSSGGGGGADSASASELKYLRSIGSRAKVLLQGARLAVVDEAELGIVQEAYDVCGVDADRRAFAKLVRKAQRERKRTPALREDDQLPGGSMENTMHSTAEGQEAEEEGAYSIATAGASGDHDPHWEEEDHESAPPARPAPPEAPPVPLPEPLLQRAAPKHVTPITIDVHQSEQPPASVPSSPSSASSSSESSATSSSSSSSSSSASSASSPNSSVIPRSGHRRDRDSVGSDSSFTSAHHLPSAMARWAEASSSHRARSKARRSRSKSRTTHSEAGIVEAKSKHSGATVAESASAGGNADLDAAVDKDGAIRMMQRALRGAQRTLEALLANLNAVSLYKDLVSRPDPTTPMCRGRVRDSDLEAIKSKVHASLAAGREAGLNTDNDESFCELERCLLELEVHVDERRRAVGVVERVLADASNHPFVMSSMGSHHDAVEASVEDTVLLKQFDAISSALSEGRKVGLVEEQLASLQEVFEDLHVYLQGREEARAEAERMNSMLEALYAAHPQLLTAEEFLARVHHSRDETADASQLSEFQDEDLRSSHELLRACIADGELVGIPVEESPFGLLHIADRRIGALLRSRALIKLHMRTMAQQPEASASRSAIRDLLNLAKDVGIEAAPSLVSSASSAAPLCSSSKKVGRDMRVLERRLAELNRSRKASLPRLTRTPSQQFLQLDELDRKLTMMVPEARRRLSAAINGGSPAELAAAINDAKTLELRLQKLRALRSNMQSGKADNNDHDDSE